MGKKRPSRALDANRVTPRKKAAAERDLTRILTQLRNDFEPRLKATGALVPSYTGPEVLGADGGRYVLKDQASDEEQMLFHGLVLLHRVMEMRGSRYYLHVGTGFCLGLITGSSMAVSDVIRLQSQVTKLTNFRSLGGKAKRILDPGQEKIALGYIAAENGPSVKKTHALQRAAAKLFGEKGINVSAKTLSRLSKRHEADNAEHCPGQS